MSARELAGIAGAFPVIGSLSPHGLDLLARRSSLVALPEGRTIAAPGGPAEQIPFVVDGEVRVHQSSEAGRDLTLYRIYPGQTCVLTALSILRNQDFTAQADTVADSSALIVPSSVFSELFEAEESFRRFVLRILADRLTDLFELIDNIVFTDLPARIADTLMTHQTSGIVQLTHERIAGEVGCSREAVSRTLKAWERAGVVQLRRGVVVVTSRAELLRKAMGVVAPAAGM